MTTIAFKNTQLFPYISKLKPGIMINNEFIFIHEDPIVTIQNNKVIKNFDILIDFQINPDLQLLLDAAYISLLRYKKSIQSVILNKIILNNNFIDKCIIPKSYGNGQSFSISHANCISNNSKVVIKRENGARGCSQVLLDSYLLYDFMGMSASSLNVLKKRFPTAIFTGIIQDHIDYKESEIKDNNGAYSYFDGDSVFVQEYIENISNEYRVLVSGDYLYCRERVINSNPFPQANSSFEDGLNNSNVYINAENVLDSTIIKVIKDLDLKLGSVDIFKKDDKFGIFEFSTEFGLSAVEPSFINELFIGFIKHIIDISGIKIE